LALVPRRRATAAAPPTILCPAQQRLKSLKHFSLDLKRLGLYQRLTQNFAKILKKAEMPGAQILVLRTTAPSFAHWAVGALETQLETT
jgi:hypothetical protein